MSQEQRIILTRQKRRNQAWHQSLVQAGITVKDLPLLRFSNLVVPEKFHQNSFDWILFTSPQGVDAFLSAGIVPKGARLGAIGSGTSAALHAAGLNDDLGFAGLDGAELARAFVDKVSAPATVLLPGPARRMPDPRQTLENAGFQVEELPLYETLPISPSELSMEFHSNDIVFFCSPSAVSAFTEAFTARPDCVAIGETTAAHCRRHGFSTQVAETPDLNAMVRAAGCEPLTSSLENES